VFKDSLEKGIT